MSKTAASLLPDGFDALEPFVLSWALSGTANRLQRRLQSQSTERQAFYDVAKNFLKPAIAYLDRTPLKQVSPQEQRLMDLMLMLAHISLAVEMQKDDEDKNAGFRKNIRLVRSVADQ